MTARRAATRRALPTFVTVLPWLLVPVAVLWAIYGQSIFIWFRADDFAWLGLDRDVASGGLFHTLFVPKAQGTIRPLSERLFFLLFHQLFGIGAVPYHLWVLLTQSVNLLLFGWLIWKLSGSCLAALIAATAWTVNAAITEALIWCSAYNQILCVFFLLSGLCLLQKHIETGKPIYYWLQWMLFVVGFGALEVQVLYPVLAAGLILCSPGIFSKTPGSRTPTITKSGARLLWGTLPLFVIDGIYLLARRAMLQSGGFHGTVGPYGLHWDASILSTFRQYLLRSLLFWPAQRWELSILSIPVLMLAFCIWRAKRGHYVPLFFFGWYLVTLVPFLPLRDHFTPYYLTIPLLGLAAVTGIAISGARHLPKFPAIAALLACAIVMGLYGFRAAFDANSQISFFQRLTGRVESLVRGVGAGARLHPGKAILLDRIDTELYGNAVAQHAFRVVGVEDAYLTPGSESQITLDPNLSGLENFFLPEGPTLNGLKTGLVEVYDAGRSPLRRITEDYEAIVLARPGFGSRVPGRVDAGNPLFSYLLDSGWFSAEVGHRWMSHRAALKLGSQSVHPNRLRITGYLPKEVFPAGVAEPLVLEIKINEKEVFRTSFFKPESPFVRIFLLTGSADHDNVVVQLGTNRTFKPKADGRDLGVAFGIFERF